jgi:hypothetical protein
MLTHSFVATHWGSTKFRRISFAEHGPQSAPVVDPTLAIRSPTEAALSSSQPDTRDKTTQP